MWLGTSYLISLSSSFLNCNIIFHIIILSFCTNYESSNFTFFSFLMNFRSGFSGQSLTSGASRLEFLRFPPKWSLGVLSGTRDSLLMCKSSINESISFWCCKDLFPVIYISKYFYLLIYQYHVAILKNDHGFTDMHSYLRDPSLKFLKLFQGQQPPHHALEAIQKPSFFRIHFKIRLSRSSKKSLWHVCWNVINISTCSSEMEWNWGSTSSLSLWSPVIIVI